MQYTRRGAQSGASDSLAATVYDPGSDTTFGSTSTSYAAMDATNLKLPNFVVPANGMLVVILSAWCQAAANATVQHWNIIDGSGDVANSDVRVAGTPGGSASAFLGRATARIPLTGLTPGATLTGWKWGMARKLGSGTCEFYAGPAFGPALMEVRRLG